MIRNKPGKMKKLLQFSLIMAAVLFSLPSGATVGGIMQDFESGNRNIERGNCWQFIGSTISANSRISGSYSGYTSALNNPNNPGRFISPWVEFSGSDEISFSFKVTSLNGATAHYLRLSLIDLNGDETELLDYTFPDTQVHSETIQVTQQGIYQVKWLFTSTGGGSSRGVLDDIFITGSYMADPTNNPGGSGACAAMAPVYDEDGDGVADDEDAYPDDPGRAFNNFTPAEGYSSLVFEDTWPDMGDYDFNDLVLYYRINEITNSNNQVAELVATFVPQAAGAGFKNGFAFMLPVPVASVSSVEGPLLTEDYISLLANGLEAGQTNAVIVVFDNSQKAFTDISGTNPDGLAGINTCDNGRTGTGIEYQISVVFANPLNPGVLGTPPFNPFLIANEIRGNEIHLPDMAPTALADMSLFGTGKDNSVPQQGRFYKTANNLPWVLNIAESYDHTIEKSQVSEGYLKFIDWAESSGNSYPGWYQNQNGYRNPQKVYHHP